MADQDTDFVIAAAQQRNADPFGFETSQADQFSISPEKIAYDILGDAFFGMNKTQRDYILELVRSGDLTSSEIAQEAQYALPYDPNFGQSEVELSETARTVTKLPFRRDVPDGFEDMPDGMSEEEFYRRYYGIGLDALPRDPQNLFGFEAPAWARPSFGFKKAGILTEEPEQPAMGLLGT